MHNDEKLQPDWFVPDGEERGDKDERSRTNIYVRWLHATGRSWSEPDFLSYQAYLLNECHYRPSTVKAHIATLRAHYRTLLENGTIYRKLLEIFDEGGNGVEGQKAAEEIIAAIYAAIDPWRTRIRFDEEPPQVEPETSTVTPLTIDQITALFQVARKRDGLLRRRDQALFALMLGFGLREHEVCNLQVDDLKQVVDGEFALHVTPGVGCVERFIPYGRLEWMLQWVFIWLEAADISSGPVFRGIHRGGWSVRDGKLSPRSVEKILWHYDQVKQGLRPSELRRAYSRLLFEAGTSLPEIKSRLGFKDANALMSFIGGDEANLGVPPGEDPIEFLRTAIDEYEDHR